MRKVLKTAGITLLAVGAAAAVAAWVVRDQVDRSQRDLFSPHPLRRLACLGHLSRAEASVFNVNLLRDFVAWEPKGLLRNRARVILSRMEAEIGELEVGGEVRSGEA
jgi:hypothetical protein